jgi:glycerate 2-kinase
VWIVAVGKAARPMARAARARLDGAGRRPAGGIVIAPPAEDEAAVDLPFFPGDHPLPDLYSVRAAEALADLTPRVRPGDDVWVFLSGGTSSLVGAPTPGISLRVLRELFRSISRSGLNIEESNAIRRRFLRWGGGRLSAALAHATVRVFAVSDVPGDDPAVIGSGPCAPDPLIASDVKRRLETHGLLDSLPPEIGAYLDRVAAGGEPETPKPQESVTPPHRVILCNDDALAAAADEARRRNYFADVAGSLDGEARDVGRAIGARMREAAPGTCLLWGGESTVTLGLRDGRGGRSQELALAAAEQLAGSRAMLLAAGTDGRDGETDAAGAVVDGETIEKLRAGTMDVRSALERHDTYPALDSIGALFRPGLTGTNVMDVVIGICPR